MPTRLRINNFFFFIKGYPDMLEFIQMNDVPIPPDCVFNGYCGLVIFPNFNGFWIGGGLSMFPKNCVSDGQG